MSSQAQPKGRNKKYTKAFDNSKVTQSIKEENGVKEQNVDIKTEDTNGQPPKEEQVKQEPNNPVDTEPQNQQNKVLGKEIIELSLQTKDVLSIEYNQLDEYYDKQEDDILDNLVEKYRQKLERFNQLVTDRGGKGFEVDDKDGQKEKVYHEIDVNRIKPSEYQIPPYCVPIHCNVLLFDFSKLYNQTMFDVIMMDPPWQLASANPTRGVSIGYLQLRDQFIESLPIEKLSQNGFIFLWVINSKLPLGLKLLEQWGYRLIDEIVWVKMTVNRRLAKSHGYYLQHATEVCLMGLKGNHPPNTQFGDHTDIIYSHRRGQSQKPEEIYELIERLVPNGKYLEIFGRKNNLRNYWVTLGNEVTGLGLPKEDLDNLKENKQIVGTYAPRTQPKKKPIGKKGTKK